MQTRQNTTAPADAMQAMSGANLRDLLCRRYLDGDRRAALLAEAHRRYAAGDSRYADLAAFSTLTAYDA